LIRPDVDLLGTLSTRDRTLLAATLSVGLLAMPALVPDGWLFDVTRAFMFGLLAFAVIVPTGYGGQLIICQGALFGVGAYSFVKLANAGVTGAGAVLGATAVTVLVAVVVGVIATRLTDIYMGIVTLAFNEMFVIALERFPDRTGGSAGLVAPSLVPSGLGVPGDVVYYYVVAGAFLATYGLVSRALASELGWALLLIKEDRRLAASIGVRTRLYRVGTFAVTGVVCGFAGALFAPFNGFLSPNLFNLDMTINIILAGILGGLVQPAGSIVGGAIVVLLPEFLRFASDVRLILYGVVLIALLIYAPNGLMVKVADVLDR
jgi:branched-chain amino acid transport system permease protein